MDTVENKRDYFAEVEEKELTAKGKIFNAIKEVGFFLALFIVTTALFLILKPLYIVVEKDVNAGKYAHMLMSLGLFCIILLAILLVITNKMNRKTAILLLFTLGVIMRVGYMLYTPITTRQHDTFNKSNTGHEAYAWAIFSTGKLPQTNDYQFYHPPLNATLQACFMHFMESLTSFLSKVFELGTDYFPDKFLQGYASSKLPKGSEMRFFLFSTTQILAVLYSVITLVYALKLIRLFNFKGKTAVLMSAIVILFPRHMQFAGMVNNDALSYMCSVVALYCAVKWQKQGKKLAYILLCALFCGLGMMTKLATATICLPIGGIFVYEFVVALKAFIKDLKSQEKLDLKKHLKLPIQFVSFLLICAPLGLWFQVYASVKFDQGFGFVFNNLNKLLKTDHHSLFQRLFITFDKHEYFGSLYCICFSDSNYEYYNNYNLFLYQIRSSIFGEFGYWQADGYGVFSLLFGGFTVLTLFVGIVSSLVIFIKNKKNKGNLFSEQKIIGFKELLIIVLLLISQLVPEMIFYVKMPYACTMDFRYIMPIISGLALTVGYVQKILTAEGSRFSIVLSNTLTGFIIAFLTFTTLFYCTCI